MATREDRRSDGGGTQGRERANYHLRSGRMGGEHNLFLPEQQEDLSPLTAEIEIRYAVLEEKFAGRTVLEGRLVKLSTSEAEVLSEHPVPPLSNLKSKSSTPSGGWPPGTSTERWSANPRIITPVFICVSPQCHQKLRHLCVGY